MKIQGVYLPGNSEAHVKEWDIPEPKGDEVLIEVKAAALCKSDMSIYHGTPLIPGYPSGTFITGHEPSGIVSKVGPCAKYLKEGDRVALIAFIGCGNCRYCRGGEPNLCNETGVLGFTTHGADAEYVIVPERVCLPLPKEIDFVAGAVSTDVIGNLYSTMKAIGLRGGDLVAITGMGPMGLSGVISAVAMGAKVIAIDLVESRLEIAKALGAQYIINSKTSDVLEAVKKISPEGADKAVECSASEAGINVLLNLVRKHGIMAQIGETGDKPIAIRPSSQLIWKKLTYIGSWYFNMNEWEEITDFIINTIGNETVKKIVSHTYPLEEASVNEAFKLFDEKKTLKVVITP
jgi:D-arabinose 1-dehydrogenase-like Zn-dependent alcohol dehydrogenase